MEEDKRLVGAKQIKTERRLVESIGPSHHNRSAGLQVTWKICGDHHIEVRERKFSITGCKIEDE
jgi:hypothetical protein